MDDHSNRLFALCLQLEAGRRGSSPLNLCVNQSLSQSCSNFFSDDGVTANELVIAISKILTIVDLETCSGMVEVAAGEIDQEFTDKFDDLATALLEVNEVDYWQYLTLKVAARRGGDLN